MIIAGRCEFSLLQLFDEHKLIEQQATKLCKQSYQCNRVSKVLSGLSCVDDCAPGSRDGLHRTCMYSHTQAQHEQGSKTPALYLPKR